MFTIPSGVVCHERPKITNTFGFHKCIRKWLSLFSFNISIKCSKSHLSYLVFFFVRFPQSPPSAPSFALWTPLKRHAFLRQTSKRNNAKFEYILIYIFRSITTAMATRRMREWKECMARVRTLFAVACVQWCALCGVVWCARVPFLYVLQHAFLLLTIKTGINVSTSPRIWSEAMFAVFTWNLNEYSNIALQTLGILEALIFAEQAQIFKEL